MNIQVFAEVAELLEGLSEQLLAYSLRGQPKHIVLSGGSTPKRWFSYMASNAFAQEIEWANLHFWWGDERMVPASDVESNYGEAMRLLFDEVVIPESNLHPIHGDALVSEELLRLERETTPFLEPPYPESIFDWVILGVGEDGHTASLFPGKTDYEDQRTWVPAVHPQTLQNRISLSAKAISAASRVTYLAMGSGKSEVVDQVMSGADIDLPAARIAAYNGETEWYLDQSAYGLR